MRILLYTGKGGVGKTSIAASTACQVAKSGKKVLIMSTDQAHSLGDSFEQKLGNEPVLVTDNLYAMEIDAVAESEAAWGNMQSYMKKLLSSRAQSGLETEELLVFPGLDELFSLFKILDFYNEGEYDVLIVDCAPTGETLSLLKFPEMFGTFIEKALPMKRKAVKIGGPLIEKLMKVPMPKDNVFDELEHLTKRLGELQSLMSNKEVVSLRIVTTPERIVIKEAKRNYTCLHLYDYNVDAIIVNRIYPEKALQGYFNKWVELQKDGLNEIEESFHGIPIFKLELQKRELKSLPILQEVAKVLYQDQEPTLVFSLEKIFTVNKSDQGYVMEIKLPFVEKKEMDLNQKGGEIILSIKNERRRFQLPDNLKSKEIQSAKYENGKLKIQFG
jgi:arsenite/tail-anchored protein-transporting ATPase